MVGGEDNTPDLLGREHAGSLSPHLGSDLQGTDQLDIRFGRRAGVRALEGLAVDLQETKQSSS